MSRPPLGTPPANVSKEQKRQANESERIRYSFVIVLRESLDKGK